MKNDWTPAQVQEHLIEAADTLRRLPDQEARFMNSGRVCWPDIPRDIGQEFANAVANGDWEQVEPRLAPPTRAAIGRYEEIMGWLNHIEGKNCVRDRKIVFAGCMSMAIWQRETIKWGFVIFTVGKMHVRKLQRIHKTGLEKIAGSLNAKIN